MTKKAMIRNIRVSTFSPSLSIKRHSLFNYQNILFNISVILNSNFEPVINLVVSIILKVV